MILTVPSQRGGRHTGVSSFQLFSADSSSCFVVVVRAWCCNCFHFDIRQSIGVKAPVCSQEEVCIVQVLQADFFTFYFIFFRRGTGADLILFLQSNEQMSGYHQPKIKSSRILIHISG